MLEIQLATRPGNLVETRIGTIVKSSVPNLPIGMQIEDPTFPKLLELAGAPKEISTPEEAPATVEAQPEAEPVEETPTLPELLDLAENAGFKREQVVPVAHRTLGKSTLETLTQAERHALEQRIKSRAQAA